MAEPILIAVVHNSAVIRTLLKQALEKTPDIREVRAFGDAEEVLLDPIRGPQILLFDWAVVEGESAASLIDLRYRLPQAKIVLLNVPDPTRAAVECILTGASGCILEDASFDELLEGIRSVWKGERAGTPRFVASPFDRVTPQSLVGGHPMLALLTRREEQVLRLLAIGLSNKEIAQHLSLRQQTVKNYVHQLFQKLRLRSRRDVLRLFHAGSDEREGQGE